MISRLRIKLFFVLLAFAIVVSFTIATIDYLRLKQQTIEDNQIKIEHASRTAKYALRTIDKAYFLLDEETARKMEEYTYELQDKYDENPNLETWDFQTLSKEIGMDIYIIDEENKITYSNNSNEIGLDFQECCKSFDQMLQERRAEGKLFIDGIDLDQQNGEVKKFSYMATKDKKYIIELGYSLENEAIFQQFNFLSVIEELIDEFPLIQELHVLNFGGLPFGTEKRDAVHPDRRKAFEQARENNEIVEIETKHEGKSAIIRYVPYQSQYDQGKNTKIKVLEIIYNQQDLDLLLHQNTRVYISQLFIILVITILVSSFIASWFAKPVYLAFHDSLTGLKNRAAFNDHIQKALSDKEITTALLMMDLDNFKLVNDYLGHGKGDFLLQLIAKTIKGTVGENYEAFRLGGDEFAVILPHTTKQSAEKMAQHIIEDIAKMLQKEQETNLLSVTVSIGIALSSENETQSSLYKKADIALYESKEKGKNQYQIYNKGEEPNIPFTSEG